MTMAALSRFASSIAKNVYLTNLLKTMCCINGDKPNCLGLSLWRPIHSIEPSGFCRRAVQFEFVLLRTFHKPIATSAIRPRLDCFQAWAIKRYMLGGTD